MKFSRLFVMVTLVLSACAALPPPAAVPDEKEFQVPNALADQFVVKVNNTSIPVETKPAPEAPPALADNSGMSAERLRHQSESGIRTSCMGGFRSLDSIAEEYPHRLKPGLRTSRSGEALLAPGCPPR